jgi:hypothetical protein
MGLDLFLTKLKVEQEIAYYRKANFLIPFFEAMSNQRVENCVYLPVNQNWIEELQERCKTLLDLIEVDKLEDEEYKIPKKAIEKAYELLPTQEGFFFGNTNYDEYYFMKVHNVYKSCPAILEEFDKLEDGECIAFYIWY